MITQTINNIIDKINYHYGLIPNVNDLSGEEHSTHRFVIHYDNINENKYYYYKNVCTLLRDIINSHYSYDDRQQFSKNDFEKFNLLLARLNNLLRKYTKDSAKIGDNTDFDSFEDSNIIDFVRSHIDMYNNELVDMEHMTTSRVKFLLHIYIGKLFFDEYYLKNLNDAHRNMINNIVRKTEECVFSNLKSGISYNRYMETFNDFLRNARHNNLLTLLVFLQNL